jgi:hypothetical protein
MRIAAVLVLAVAIMVPAKAAPADELFRQFGLLGAWAPDCGQAAAPANPHVRISVAGSGEVLEDHDLGPGFAVNHYRMLSARELSAEQLSVETIFRSGDEAAEHQRLVFLVHGGTRRTMLNQTEDGETRVKDGIALGGSKTPVLNKCE